jgi:hypothetical protein
VKIVMLIFAAMLAGAACGLLVPTELVLLYASAALAAGACLGLLAQVASE